MPVASIGSPHQATQGVNLGDKMSLGRPADRRIARHVRDGFGGQQRADRDAAPHPRSGMRRFAPRVTRADHDDVEVRRHQDRCRDSSLISYARTSRRCSRQIVGRALPGDFLEGLPSVLQIDQQELLR